MSTITIAPLPPGAKHVPPPAHQETTAGSYFVTNYPPFNFWKPEFVPELLAAIGPSGGTETILVVEDEEMLRDLVTTLLNQNGYKVLTAADGLQAVEVYTRHREEIALVIADIGLPKLNGTEALLRIKEINSAVKTILVSGYLDPEFMNNLQKTGANDFIQKPYVPSEICSRVRKALDTPPKG